MNFQYKVRDASGKITSGMADAADRDTVIQELKQRGYAPIAVMPAKGEKLQGPVMRPRKPAAVPFWQKSIGKAVKDEEVLLFTRDLYSLVHAAVPLVSGIGDLAAQVKNANFRYALVQISEDVNAGSKLSEALARHPKIFSEFYIHNISAGEQSGRLEHVLESLISALDHEIETSIMVRNAVRYPLIVLGFMVIAFFIILTVIIPKVSGTFSKFGAELPLPTRILIAIGNFSQAYGLFILAGIFISAVLIALYRKTPRGRYLWDAVMLRLPVFGDLIRKIALSKFASTLQTLYASGIVLNEALKGSANVVGNAVMARAVLQSAEEVGSGRPMSDTLRANRIFPPMVIRMVMMGEKTGALEGMLGEIKSHYDREVQYTSKKLGTLIEPILTVILGLMILVMALGVFLPMWNFMKLFKG